MMPYRYYPPPYPIPRMPYPPLPTPPIVTPTMAPSKIEQFLQSTGQFMKTAQTYAPYVQQAVPMFKNIPALFRLYKGFQNAPNASEKSASPKGSSKSDTFSKSAKQPKRSADYSTKPSLPKIYQPE